MILLAEDNKIIAELFKTVLLNSGYRVCYTEDGKKALDLLEKHEVKLIISDFNLPSLNGIELIKKAKEKSSYKTILMSGNFPAGIENIARESKIDFLLHKPFLPSQLLKAVKILLPDN